MKINWIVLIVWLFAAPFIIASGVILYHNVSDEWKARATESWEPTTAIVQKVSLDAITKRGMESDYELVGYIVKVKYDYTWKNQNYEGKRIAFGYGIDQNHSNAKQKFIYEKLEEAKGQPIKIWVDPAQPDEATIAVGWNFSMLLLYAQCFVLIFFPVAFATTFTWLLADVSWMGAFCATSWLFLILTFVALFFLDTPDFRIIEQIEIVSNP